MSFEIVLRVLELIYIDILIKIVNVKNFKVKLSKYFH